MEFLKILGDIGWGIGKMVKRFAKGVVRQNKQHTATIFVLLDCFLMLYYLRFDGIIILSFARPHRKNNPL